MSSVPLRTSSAALMRVLCCQHPQKTMAPAVADEDTLGLGRLYIIIIDEACPCTAQLCPPAFRLIDCLLAVAQAGSQGNAHVPAC